MLSKDSEVNNAIECDTGVSSECVYAPGVTKAASARNFLKFLEGQRGHSGCIWMWVKSKRTSLYLYQIF